MPQNQPPAAPSALSEVELVPTRPSTDKKSRELRTVLLEGGVSLQIEATAKDHRALLKKLDAVVKLRNKLERKPIKKRLTAKHADRHELYQLSVQSPEEDIKFLRKVYKSLRKKPAVHFREDFSGTHLLATEWVRTRAGCTAEGFDNDPDPVAWGLHMNARRLKGDTERLRLSIADVREPSFLAPDVRCAQNFSYWCFQERAELVDYFKSVHKDLAEDGVFVLDLHGGSETQEEMEEEREIHEGFTYVWDQHSYWPIPGRAVNHIHFRFDDGTELYRAFTYDWRLWGLPELRDCLTEAGFQSVTTYWEGTDKDGESGNGVFKPAKRGEADLSWIAYLAAAK